MLFQEATGVVPVAQAHFPRELNRSGPTYLEEFIGGLK